MSPENGRTDESPDSLARGPADLTGLLSLTPPTYAAVRGCRQRGSVAAGDRLLISFASRTEWPASSCGGCMPEPNGNCCLGALGE